MNAVLKSRATSPRRNWLHIILPIILVIALSLPAMLDLFKPGYYSSHDGTGHVIRMDEFYRSFKDGEFPVRWSKRLYFGYGYPFYNFNYPSVYYAGLPVMLLGFSASVAMKGETIITFILSGLFMYGYMRRKVREPYAILAAVLYMYAPYRFVNIYVRGSVAESAAFIFAPLLLWGAEAMSIGRKKSVLITGLVIFLLGISHNISALLLFGFFFLYSLFLALQRKSLWPLIRSGMAFALGLMMAAFFFVPALLEKKITFLDQTIAKDYPNYFIDLFRLVKLGWGYGSGDLSFNVGLVQLALLVLFLLIFFVLRREKKFVFRYKTLFFFCVVIFVGSAFFMIPPSRIFWDHLPLLPFVQFPWRFLMLTVPALAIMGVVGLENLTRQYVLLKKHVMALTVMLIAATLVLTAQEWRINQVEYAKEVPGDALEGSTTWADEQATHWFLPKPHAPAAQKIEFINGKGGFSVIQWKATNHRYAIVNPESLLVVENTMYYPGWRVWIDGKEAEIQYQRKDYPGRIVFSMPAGVHVVESKFTETPTRLAMDILSAVTLLGVVGALVVVHKKKS